MNVFSSGNIKCNMKNNRKVKIYCDYGIFEDLWVENMTNTALNSFSVIYAVILWSMSLQGQAYTEIGNIAQLPLLNIWKKLDYLVRRRITEEKGFGAGIAR